MMNTLKILAVGLMLGLMAPAIAHDVPCSIEQRLYRQAKLQTLHEKMTAFEASHLPPFTQAQLRGMPIEELEAMRDRADVLIAMGEVMIAIVEMSDLLDAHCELMTSV